MLPKACNYFHLLHVIVHITEIYFSNIKDYLLAANKKINKNKNHQPTQCISNNVA